MQWLNFILPIQNLKEVKGFGNLTIHYLMIVFMWTKLKIQLENAVFPYNPGDVHNGRSIFAYRGSIILWTTSVRNKGCNNSILILKKQNKKKTNKKH